MRAQRNQITKTQQTPQAVVRRERWIALLWGFEFWGNDIVGKINLRCVHQAKPARRRKGPRLGNTDRSKRKFCLKGYLPKLASLISHRYICKEDGYKKR